MYKEESTCVNEDLLSLSRGPFYGIQRFSGYIINGFRFHTKQLEGKRVKQNSGVLVKGMVENKNIDYYGVLNEIIELQYLNEKRIVLFKCDWWDVHVIGRGVKNDKYGFVSVNTARKLYTNEPFVLASQAQQIFYVNDGSNPNWLVVLKGRPDSFYDLPCGEKSSIDEEAFQQDSSEIDHQIPNMFEDDGDLINWKRHEISASSSAIVDDDHSVDEERDAEDIDDSDIDDEDLLIYIIRLFVTFFF